MVTKESAWSRYIDQSSHSRPRFPFGMVVWFDSGIWCFLFSPFVVTDGYGVGIGGGSDASDGYRLMSGTGILC